MRFPGRFLLVFAAVLCSAVAFAQSSQHLFFRVTLGSQFTSPVSGRMIIFLEPGEGAKSVDEDPFHPTAVYIAAKEVSDLKPGGSVEIDTDELAYPAAFSSIKPGDYQVQAVLDVGHTYNYSGRGPGDLISDVTPLHSYTPGQSDEPNLTLDATVPERPVPPNLPSGFTRAAHEADFVSPALTAFFGRPIHMRAWVVVPPDYDSDPSAHYPTVYWTHGFGANLFYAKLMGARLYERMEQHKIPPMIWVMLDESGATGTHEFANSVNNGPWGTALITEFIPYLESKYRMDARVSGRFLQGHSSGGWATLQLQVNYPTIFGGTWSTSPDPSDFHDFTGIDLYAPHANAYLHADGTPIPIVRDHGKVIGTFQQFSLTERVLGDYGGQVASFEWVFSPRGSNGRPLPMFNRDTGDVDPAVVAYWHDHYDLAHIVQSTWAQRGPDLRGKIHVFVGTADTFYLDGAAHEFDAVLKDLNADAHFTYIPDRTHFDLYFTYPNGGKEDRSGLFDQIAAEMYAVARPGNNWQSAQ
ncbi:MAG TPA: alpha/beta hydrolase-fold protein [Terracidiphilus sp.]|nr:alpha/beta hydrolase-fold protein [Terracidiphilus sp.]